MIYKTLLCLIFIFAVPTEAFNVPKMKGAVTDNAHLLTRSEERSLEKILRQFKARGGTQIAVLTVKSLEGQSIEQASIQVTDQWQLGDKTRDDGVLILVAKKERKIRIEVGQGLEGALTDIYSKRIISDGMSPLFKSGDFASGIVLGIFHIAQKTNPDIRLQGVSRGASQRGSGYVRSKKNLSLFEIIKFVGIFLIFLIFPSARWMGLGFLMGGGFGGRRGGSFGGGGFGSYSGGGGGFSGGGASGGW